MTFVTQGMDKDALVSTTQRLIQEFLDTELGGITIQEWLGSIWNVFVLAGKIVMGRPLTEEMMDFAQWVAGKYVAHVGVNQVYSDQSVTFSDGSVYSLAVLGKSYSWDWSVFPPENCQIGTSIPIGSIDDPVSIELISGQYARFRQAFSSKGKASFSYYSPYFDTWSDNSMLMSDLRCACFCIFNSKLELCVFSVFSGDFVGEIFLLDTLLSESDTKKLLIGETSLSLNARSESMSYIPEGIAAEQGIALDVGAASTMDLDQVLGGVLEDVLAGTLESTMAAADEKTEPVDPPAGEITDVDDLGLPALGAALTSRFPFSIPWDFFRAVQLLAASAKAPYFEVDFMEPLADDVGGWQGDTTVILDFSEYAIIGQISRWTSTIGFCLMLAGATKRLIWTA